MDSTLLGALIGAGSAIVGGMLTAAWTNHSSKNVNCSCLEMKSGNSYILVIMA